MNGPTQKIVPFDMLRVNGLLPECTGRNSRTMSGILISDRREDSADVIGSICDQLIQLLSYNPLGMYFWRLNTKTVRTTWSFPCYERLLGGVYE